MSGGGLATMRPGTSTSSPATAPSTATPAASTGATASCRMTTTGRRHRLLHAVQPGRARRRRTIDLGSGGALLLPDQPGAHPHEMVSAGKNGTIYLVDRDNMGHYNTTTNNVIQTLANIFPNGTPEPGNFSSPVYFNGTSSSARWRRQPPGVQAHERAALDDGRRSLRRRLPRPWAPSWRVRERIVQRDPLGRCSGTARARPASSTRTTRRTRPEACSRALRQLPGRLARHARRGREVQRPTHRQRQGVRRRHLERDRLRAPAVGSAGRPRGRRIAQPSRFWPNGAAQESAPTQPGVTRPDRF